MTTVMLTTVKSGRRRSRLPLLSLSLLLCGSVLASSGCAGRSDAMAEKVAPEADFAGGGAAVDEITAFENQLAMREQELRGYGVYLPSEPSGGAARAVADLADSGGDASTAAASEGQFAGEDDVDAAMPMAESEPEQPAAAEEAGPPADPTSRDSRREKKARARQCRQVCEIRAAICQLETNICSLAGRHPGEARYENACARASTDCAVASRACDDCSE